MTYDEQMKSTTHQKLINGLLGTSVGVVLLVCILSFTTACTDDNEAQRALTNQGFSNITIVDRGSWFSSFHGCSDGDGNWYSVTADNSTGKRVNVTVCCGGVLQFKGCTLRSQ
jgi:hypothetical protein